MALLLPSSLHRFGCTPLPPISFPCPGNLRLPLKIEARKHPPKTESDKVRNLRARKLLTGTREKPRLLVFCSDKHLYAQIIDDTRKHIIVSACTSQRNVAVDKQSACPVVEAAKKIGEEVAKECLRQGITKVIYYRRGSLHWQRVVAFRRAAEGHGLKIQYPQ